MTVTAMTLPILAACAVVLSISPVRAQSDEKCNDANSTAEIVQCLAGQTAIWDRRLNAAYQTLMGDLPARRREQLRGAQRLWIQFRDANCGYFASGEGSIARIEAAQCLYRMTSSRTLELEAGR
jgi:uncharacterized protein YecT (DUF1311 family)